MSEKSQVFQEKIIDGGYGGDDGGDDGRDDDDGDNNDDDEDVLEDARMRLCVGLDRYCGPHLPVGKRLSYIQLPQGLDAKKTNITRLSYIQLSRGPDAKIQNQKAMPQKYDLVLSCG